MASISAALERIKSELQELLPDQVITDACEECGHSWRQRLLDPVTTIHLFILQVLNFNTALTHLPHLSDVDMSASAFCKARKRLPLEVFKKMLRHLCDACVSLSDVCISLGDACVVAGDDCDAPESRGRFLGHRLLLVDGSSSSMPDEPELQKEFGQPAGHRPGCGFPMAKVLGLFDAATGMLLEMLAFPLYTHEQSKVSLLHPLLRAGDLLCGDRGFCSFWHAALLSAREIFCLFRVHQKQIVNFRPHRRAHRKGDTGRPSSRFLRRLGKHDQLVEWKKPKQRPAWMSVELYAALPAVLQVRELRYRIPRKGQRTLCVTIMTTLLDPEKYPKAEVAKLYGLRWEVETHFRELKTTLKMRVLKCKSVEGVQKELAVYGMVYNLVRRIMLQAARRQSVDCSRISLTDAVRWLQTAAPGEGLVDLIIVPLRPDRHEPRVLKRRAKQYDLMNKPRSKLRKLLKRRAVRT
jgi:hypothetical protein